MIPTVSKLFHIVPVGLLGPGGWLNLALGGGKVESGVEVCLFLARWQLRHALVHCLTSHLMLGQTNRAVMRHWVAFIPGCDIV